MNFKGHLIAGMLVGGFLAYLPKFLNLPGFEQTNFFLLFLCFVLFSIFPDIDINSHPRIIFTCIFLSLMLLAFFLHNYFLLVINFILLILMLVSSHRGFLHSLPASFLFPLLVFFFTTRIEYYVFGWIGYITHLLLD